MTIGPLDQLYIDTTSKEDLLAEINDQRRQVIEARGLAADIERRLWAVEKERDALAPLVAECEALRQKLKHARCRGSQFKNQLAKKRPPTKKSLIIALIEQGLRPAAIRDLHGFNYQTILDVWQSYHAAKKSAQGQS